MVKINNNFSILAILAVIFSYYNNDKTVLNLGYSSNKTISKMMKSKFQFLASEKAKKVALCLCAPYLLFKKVCLETTWYLDLYQSPSYIIFMIYKIYFLFSTSLMFKNASAIREACFCTMLYMKFKMKLTLGTENQSTWYLDVALIKPFGQLEPYFKVIIYLGLF